MKGKIFYFALIYSLSSATYFLQSSSFRTYIIFMLPEEVFLTLLSGTDLLVSSFSFCEDSEQIFLVAESYSAAITIPCEESAS